MVDLTEEEKVYWRTYRADYPMGELNFKLMELIMEYRPKRVFEFGCGTGKNLVFLREKLKCDVVGLDISYQNIAHCFVNHLNNSILGDESMLPYLSGFDITFTCGVLDHIPNIEGITFQLQRMASNAVLLGETRSKSDNHYYIHEYEDYGFQKTEYTFHSPLEAKGDGCDYDIWKWER